MKWLIAIFLVVFAVKAFALSEQTQDEQSQLSQKPIPEWSLLNQEGEQFDETSFRGKPLIITIWGTWCPHCKKLHPELQRLYEKYESQGLQVVGISVNEKPGVNPAAELISRGITFPTLVNGDDIAINVFGAFGTPTTLFIGPDGHLLGQTMQSVPNDPRFEKIAAHLVSMQN